MLPATGRARRHRLRGAAAFARIFRSGRRLEATRLQLLVLPATEAQGRIGYVIGSKQMRRAVDRNRLKRLLREAWRARREVIAGYDIVLRLRRGAAAADLPEIATEASALLDALEAAPAR